MEPHRMSMVNVLILLEQWLLKGYLLTLTQLRNLEPTMNHFHLLDAQGGTIQPPLGVGTNRG